MQEAARGTARPASRLRPPQKHGWAGATRNPYRKDDRLLLSEVLARRSRKVLPPVPDGKAATEDAGPAAADAAGDPAADAPSSPEADGGPASDGEAAEEAAPRPADRGALLQSFMMAALSQPLPPPEREGAADGGDEGESEEEPGGAPAEEDDGAPPEAPGGPAAPPDIVKACLATALGGAGASGGRGVHDDTALLQKVREAAAVARMEADRQAEALAPAPDAVASGVAAAAGAARAGVEVRGAAAGTVARVLANLSGAAAAAKAFATEGPLPRPVLPPQEHRQEGALAEPGPRELAARRRERDKDGSRSISRGRGRRSGSRKRSRKRSRSARRRRRSSSGSARSAERRPRRPRTGFDSHEAPPQRALAALDGPSAPLGSVVGAGDQQMAERLAAARRPIVGTIGEMQLRPGDWTCPVCAAHNFASKFQCFRCKRGVNPFLEHSGNTRATPDVMGHGVMPAASQMKVGDWLCSSCAAHNYASKFLCFRCGKGQNPVLQSGMAPLQLPSQAQRAGRSAAGEALKAAAMRASQPTQTGFGPAQL